MNARDSRPHVLIVGDGIAALELLLALRVLADGEVAVTLLSPNRELAPRAMTVAEPFARGGAQSYDWAQIAEHQDAGLVVDRFAAVDTAARTVFTPTGRRLEYDILVVATGAARVEPLAGVLTFGGADDAAPSLRRLVADVLSGAVASIAFTMPGPSTWPLPLYELAVLTANELREHGSAVPIRIVTPEDQPLGLFGPAALDALLPTLSALDVELMPRAQPRAVVDGGLKVADGAVIPADRVIALADVVARPLAGLPLDRGGFVPVDLHGRVVGETGVYAAGEVTSFPLRQGGIATQQADTIAEAIAAVCGIGPEPQPFRPVLRGRLMTSGAPLYLQARPSGQSLASTRALWSPPEKIAGRFLAPYLATARPGRIGPAALAERVPAVAGAANTDRDAITLALELAGAEARCGNEERALQALDAAQALDPALEMPSYGRLRAGWSADVAT